MCTKLLSTDMTKGMQRCAHAKQKNLGCKKGDANQKQQLSDYIVAWPHTHATKNFDIKNYPATNRVQR